MLYSKIEGSGKPLLILHGFLGMSDNWNSLGSQYAENGFEVHIPDMRNHGRSFHSEEFNYDVMAQDIFEYCQEKNLSDINMIGHSMGGKTAMFFAVKHPEIVEKLIVADIGPKYYRPHHQDLIAALRSVDFAEVKSRKDVEEILLPLIPDFGTRQFLMKNLYWKEPGKLGYRFNLEVFAKFPDAIGTALPDEAIFNKPTLFVKGDRSDYIKEEAFPKIKHHFPQATIETISNAGHWLHADNPKEFFENTISFLNQ